MRVGRRKGKGSRGREKNPGEKRHVAASRAVSSGPQGASEDRAAEASGEGRPSPQPPGCLVVAGRGPLPRRGCCPVGSPPPHHRQLGQTLSKKGLAGLTTLKYRGDLGNLSPAQQQRLKEEVGQARFRCTAQAQDWLQKTFGKTFSLSGTRKLLGRLGCTFHKASSFLFKA